MQKMMDLFKSDGLDYKACNMRAAVHLIYIAFIYVLWLLVGIVGILIALPFVLFFVAIGACSSSGSGKSINYCPKCGRFLNSNNYCSNCETRYTRSLQYE